MKFSKRLLCTLLAVLVTLTSIAVVPASAAFTDLEANHNAYDAVNVLSKLGVINGYVDGSFRPNNNVTRAEFTAMLLRTRGLGAVGSTSLENPPFPDVTTPDVSWAIANIRTAREMGIINGYDDGTFKPNNNVLYEEAVKMIVCALGYGEMGAEGAFWYSKYLMTATSLGFTEGAGGAVSVPATRATIANMLYNCLEVELAEDNKITEKTILEHDLKLTKNVGYISSNPEISLSQPDANLRDDEVEISVNGVASTYKVDDASKYSDMLGAQIEFYFKNDLNSGLKHLILATVKNSTTIKVDADLIQSWSANGIRYFKDEDAQRETGANIAADSVVVYNGKIYGVTAAASSFATYYANESLPLVGDMELVDRNGDNIFDVIFVNDYEPYFVSSVTSSDYKVTDNALRNGLSGGNQKILNYKANDIEFVTKDGAATTFSAIKKGSVIFVAQDKHSSGDAKVIVCNDTVSGKITSSSSSKGITVNGQTYKFSNLAPWENTIPGASPTLTTAPQMGDTAKFYLDLSGNVIWYDKTEAASNQQYGYITGAKYDSSDFEETAQVMIATKSNVKGSVYTITTKSKINGSTEALSDFITKLDKANDRINDPAIADSDYRQLVKFTTSKGTEIDEIITAEAVTSGKEIVSDNLYIYKPSSINSGTSLSYNRTNSELGGDVYIGNATFIINVSNPSKYSIMSLSDFKNNATYNVEVFDVTTTDSAKAVIVYGSTASIGELTGKAPVVLVNEKIQGENYTLYDIAGNSYVLSSEDTTTNSVAAGINTGDVVRLGGSEGEYTLKATAGNSAGNIHGYVVSSLASASSGLYASETDEGGNVDYRILWGSVYKQYDGERLIVSKTILDGWDGTGERPTVSPEEFNMKKSWFTNTKIYKYTPSSNTPIEDITGDGYEAVLEGLTYYNDAGDTISRPAEIFIHMSNETTVKTLIIIER